MALVRRNHFECPFQATAAVNGSFCNNCNCSMKPQRSFLPLFWWEGSIVKLAYSESARLLQKVNLHVTEGRTQQLEHIMWIASCLSIAIWGTTPGHFTFTCHHVRVDVSQFAVRRHSATKAHRFDAAVGRLYARCTLLKWCCLLGWYKMLQFFCSSADFLVLPDCSKIHNADP